jgi:hypothetical protein
MLKYLLVVVMLASIVGCGSTKVDEIKAKADAAVSVLAANLEKDGTKPAPAPSPDGKCPTCKGTGQVGDGNHFAKCMDCNGTGKIGSASSQTPQQPAVPVPPKRLLVYGASWCVPCVVFKNNKPLQDVIKSKGIEIKFLDIDNPQEVTQPVVVGNKTMKTVPFFVYEVNGVPVYWFEGAVDLNKLN